MISYRAEVWCDGKGECAAHDGTFHGNHLNLPKLAKQIVKEREKAGWVVTPNGKHYCPKHAAEAQGK